MRWTFDFTLLRFLQPLSASFIPLAAWYCFSQAHSKKRFHLAHFIAPVFILLAAFSYPIWRLPIDPILTLLYLGYGIALIKSSLNNNIPEKVSLSEIDKALKAKRVAGSMLIFAAAIDGSLALDFAFYDGSHAIHILMIGHAVLLPVLSLAVIMLSLSIRQYDNEDDMFKDTTDNQSMTLREENTPDFSSQISSKDRNSALNKSSIDHNEATNIVHKLDELMKTKEVFLDPDLTLDRLARKLIIPSRQISAAINHVYGRNISQVINEYRIERAKELLKNTQDPITQIYLNSGFQTKSNFHREFTRIEQTTPSAYRKSLL
ncbi:AraC family transcriptional regulator [Marinomonas sp. 15G1-11]|uniref:AraC family transcriptional regulator n=1 Tax=Marinomonas phaeophyticola TaxID=3004091 RepID=A0ABT4JVA4_9GAMM|nr:AraC family transcriptional regulator [Marinomonas sp. 15G1-11]MCZ2722269.1 AraC family transcriptional regulator [Marinomonas sp. 15G1-11]